VARGVELTAAEARRIALAAQGFAKKRPRSEPGLPELRRVLARLGAVQARIEQERPGYAAAIEREIVERGPLALGDLTDAARRDKVRTKYAESTTLWWSWSDGKSVLEGLYDSGKLAIAGRRGGFERLYDLSERVVPSAVLAVPTPPEDEAQRTLVRHAASALGVATVRELAD
jgi:hypothetical protein